MKIAILLALLTIAVLCTVALPVTRTNLSTQHVLNDEYDAIKIFRVPTGNNIVAISELMLPLGLKRWTTRTGYIDVAVPDDKYNGFIDRVKKISAQRNVTLDAVFVAQDNGKGLHDLVPGEFFPYILKVRFEIGQDPIYKLPEVAWFLDYHPYAEHVRFLKDLVITFPRNSRTVEIGYTGERRPITGINIYGSSGPSAKPAIIIYGTVHAREWISTMVTESLAYNLLIAASSNHGGISSYLEMYDFYFFPIVNPDGFVYSQTTDRDWRKNRSPPPPGSKCYGTDLNRNWAHHAWGETGGASTDPCSEDYKGTKAESEPETVALASFLTERTKAKGVKLFLDIHSYGQFLLYPYGHKCDPPHNVPHNSFHLARISAGYVQAIGELYDTKYIAGPSCATLNKKTTGDSTDYAVDNLGINFAFTAELRPKGDINFGFELSADEIVPSAIENWFGFKYLLQEITKIID